MHKKDIEEIVRIVLEGVEDRVGSLREQIGCESFDEIVERVETWIIAEEGLPRLKGGTP